MTPSYQDLFSNNKTWVREKNRQNPDFFQNMADGQQPKYLWIGCSDSRVSDNAITGTAPGDMFVHRNIANMVVHNDMSMLSVLDYAVNVLAVEHIIVCGHYGCGGVAAAMGNRQIGLIDNWLRYIKDVYRRHQDELNAIDDATHRLNRFVELNVQEQVHDLSTTTIVQNAWASGQSLQIHGLVYDLKTGLLTDLALSNENPDSLDPVYQLNPTQRVVA